MDIVLLMPVAGIAFVALLLAGRAQIAKGANTSVANGAVLLVMATLVGLVALSLLVSLDGW